VGAQPLTVGLAPKRTFRRESASNGLQNVAFEVENGGAKPAERLLLWLTGP
jgi:hypothetical protein